MKPILEKTCTNFTWNLCLTETISYNTWFIETLKQQKESSIEWFLFTSVLTMTVILLLIIKKKWLD